MTRKTFVKKLMGIGISRNEANEISTKSRKSGIPYQKYYEYECSWLKIANAMKKVGTSAKNFSKAMNLASQTMMSFGEAICAVAHDNT